LAAMSVLELVMKYSDRSLQEYYARDVVNLRKAFEKDDVVSYAEYLDDFINAIIVE
jgi:hypothetical protein